MTKPKPRPKSKTQTTSDPQAGRSAIPLDRRTVEPRWKEKHKPKG